MSTCSTDLRSSDSSVGFSHMKRPLCRVFTPLCLSKASFHAPIRTNRNEYPECGNERTMAKSDHSRTPTMPPQYTLIRKLCNSVLLKFKASPRIPIKPTNTSQDLTGGTGLASFRSPGRTYRRSSPLLVAHQTDLHATIAIWITNPRYDESSNGHSSPTFFLSLGG